MNGQETEVKFFVKDLNRVEMRLRELKAHLIQARVHEVNLRFDNPNGDLRKELKVLRLRNDTEAKFTFKGPNEERNDGVLSRKEIEFTVSSFDAAKEFLEALGFTAIAFYEKYRTTYELNDIHVMLDELPYGNFVEIEGENVSILRQVAGALGLNWDAAVSAGYLVLFDHISAKYKLTAGQLSFEALKMLEISGEDMSIVPAD
jgi:adenylate cyclase class 2